MLHSRAVFWTHLFVRESKNSHEDVRSSFSPCLINPPKANTREPAAAKAWHLRPSCIGVSEVTVPDWLFTSIRSAWFVNLLLRLPPVTYNFPRTQRETQQIALKLLIGQHSWTRCEHHIILDPNWHKRYYLSGEKYHRIYCEAWIYFFYMRRQPSSSAAENTLTVGEGVSTVHSVGNGHSEWPFWLKFRHRAEGGLSTFNFNEKNCSPGLI